MKIYAIKEKDDVLGWLLYYEKERKFYIELPDHADPWKTPLLLSSFAEWGQTTINSYWSSMWVSQRIIPSDRQNIGDILKDNGLSEYDEHQMLVLAAGRCVQDDYYIEETEIPNELQRRFRCKGKEVL